MKGSVMTGRARQQRSTRTDARRNRLRLLTEADAVFREHGTDASLESVARRAGVAIGTLYSHFSTRRALVCALLRTHNDALFEHGEQLLAQADAREGLVAWIHAVVEHAATYRGLAALLAEGADDAASELHDSCRRMTRIGDELIDKARRSGTIRTGVTGDDVFALMNAAAWTREHTSPGQADRLVAYTLTGLLDGPDRTGGH